MGIVFRAINAKCEQLGGWAQPLLLTVCKQVANFLSPHTIFQEKQLISNYLKKFQLPPKTSHFALERKLALNPVYFNNSKQFIRTNWLKEDLTVFITDGISAFALSGAAVTDLAALGSLHPSWNSELRKCLFLVFIED